MPFRVPPLDFSSSPRPFKDENAAPKSESTPQLLTSPPRAEVNVDPNALQLGSNTPRYSVLRGPPSINSGDGDSASERDSFETVRAPTVFSIGTPSSNYKARNKLQKKIRSPAAQSPQTTVSRNGSIRSRCRSLFGKPPTLRPMLSPQPQCTMPRPQSRPPIVFDDEESLPRSSMATWTTEYADALSDQESITQTTPELPVEFTSFYRCDIHASSGREQRLLESKTKARIIESGGKLMEDDTLLVGGFLYEMPVGKHSPFIGRVHVGGGDHLDIQTWQPWEQAYFNGLRMNPVSLPTSRDIS